MLAREMRRGHTLLIRDARLFLGDGNVIEQGAVLVKDGKIAEIFTGSAPDPKTLKAEAIDAAGKTLMPGLIDVHIHLGSPGGFYGSGSDYEMPDKAFPRELAAYLYSGVTAVKSAGDVLDAVLKARDEGNSGEKLGAELFAVGPLFTAPGGHGTEYSKNIPEVARGNFDAQFLRLPKTPEEAKKMVDELAKRHVDGIKTILEAGSPAYPFVRMDPMLVKAIADEAHTMHLPVVCHTGNARDVEDAVNAGVDGIEHGSMTDAIPEAVFARMKQKGITVRSDARRGGSVHDDRAREVRYAGPHSSSAGGAEEAARIDAEVSPVARWRKDARGTRQVSGVDADVQSESAGRDAGWGDAGHGNGRGESNDIPRSGDPSRDCSCGSKPAFLRR